MLVDLIDDTRTDKHSWHNYLETYERKFQRMKYTAKNILEIGIDKGGSIKLWHDYFPNATIYGIDIMHIDTVWDGIKNNDRIKLMTSTDAYDENMIKDKFVDSKITFDVIIDDGPHSIESMVWTAKHMSRLLGDDGVLVIEDIQDANRWIGPIITSFDSDLISKVQVVDLRPIRNVYDDVLIILDKSIKY